MLRTIYLSASIRFGKQSHLHMGNEGGLGVRRGDEYLMRDAHRAPHLAGKVHGDPGFCGSQ
jgi:hypothetical protein